MTEHDVRTSIGTTPLPRPRTAVDDDVVADDPIAVGTAPVEAGQGTTAPRPETAHFPWPEPWHFSRGARPRTEFWDVATASWRSRGPVRPTSPEN